MNSLKLIAFLTLWMIGSPTHNEILPVNQSLYFQQTEVSNQQWALFESYLLENQKDIEQYRKNDVFKVEAYNHSYYSSFKDYPVVGVTKQGAQAYCKWLNKQENALGIYRLPTKEEFHSAIREGEMSKKYQKQKIKSQKKNELFYNLYSNQEDVHMTSPVSAFFPNKYGIKNLIGNVSEHVSEKGIVVCGSWRDQDQLRWDFDVQQYTEPQSWIGFRCVCEVE